MRNLLGPNSTWLVSTRLDTFDSVERVETSVSRRTCRAWRVCRAVLFQHGGRRRGSSACVYKFSFLCFERTREENRKKSTTLHFHSESRTIMH